MDIKFKIKHKIRKIQTTKKQKNQAIFLVYAILLQVALFLHVSFVFYKPFFMFFCLFICNFVKHTIAKMKWVLLPKYIEEYSNGIKKFILIHSLYSPEKMKYNAPNKTAVTVLVPCHP